MINGQSYCFVPVTIVHQYVHLVEFAFYIPISEEKIIPIHYQDEDIPGVLKRYLQKGMTNLLFKEHDYINFLDSIRKEIQKNQTITANPDDALEFLNGTYQFLYDSMTKMGIPEMGVQTALELNRKIMQTLSKQKNFWQQLKKMRTRCNEQFLRNLYASILLNQMISFFPWQSPQLQEKVMLAVLLSDLGLSNKEQQAVREKDRNPEIPLSTNLTNHPLVLSQLLAQNSHFNSKEVLELIEQAHERPDGKGFPRGLSAASLSLLSSLHITTRAFVDHIFENKFNQDVREEILNQMSEIFHENFFKASMDILKHVVNINREFNS
jgi:hypothetical protein